MVKVYSSIERKKKIKKPTKFWDLVIRSEWTEEIFYLFPQEIISLCDVVLKRAPAEFIKLIKKVGSLTVLDCREQGVCIEWTAFNEYKVVENQEWSIVVPDAAKDGSETDSTDSSFTNAKPNKNVIRIMSSELNGIEIHNQELRLNHRLLPNCSFTFAFSPRSIDNFLSFLVRANYIQKVSQRRNVYTFVDHSDRDKLKKSFAELNIEDIRNPKTRGNAGWSDFTYEMFAKVPTLLTRRDDSPPSPSYESLAVELNADEARKAEDMMRSISEPEQDIEAHLPPRTETKREQPLTLERLKVFQAPEGYYTNVDAILQIIFRGGIDDDARPIVWKLLLGYDRWEETEHQQEHRRMMNADDYYRMKRQWTSISEAQENNFTDYRDRKCQIEKDVKRTDRNLEYFEGEDNPNLVKLQNILMTYIMYNFDLGYVQGMSDLLAPILMRMENEEDSFWCFVGFMDKVFHNFDIDQAGMKRQLTDLNLLLCFANPKLYHYFVEHQSDNMYFCFRWLLVWFKREFSNQDILTLWEVLWTGLPCKNFHLFVAIAILDEEAPIFIEQNYEFNEILKVSLSIINFNQNRSK